MIRFPAFAGSNGKRNPYRFLVAVILLATSICAAAQATPASKRDARLFVEQGIAAMQRGDAGAAELAFQKALKSGGANTVAHTYLGVIADQKGDLKVAEQHFAAALRSDPKSPSALNNHGAVLQKLGRTA